MPEISSGVLAVFATRCHLSTTHDEGDTLYLLTAKQEAGKLPILMFMDFGLSQSGIEPEFTVSVTDSLFAGPLNGVNIKR